MGHKTTKENNLVGAHSRFTFCYTQATFSVVSQLNKNFKIEEELSF